MANTLPIIGTNNLGLTSKLPRWDHRLRFIAGSLVIFDTDSSTTAVDYRVYLNTMEDKVPTTEAMNPTVDSDWMEIPFVLTADKKLVT